MEFAPGIPSKRIKEVPRISEPQEWRRAIQLHHANRAGVHYDLRIVDDKTGKAYSWAVRNLPTNPGDKTLAKLQPTHTSTYSTWSGTIAEGYGAGTVKLFSEDKIEVLKADLDHLTFNVYKSNGDTERYALINTGDDNWLFHNVTPTRKSRPQLPEGKPTYKSTDITALDPNNPNQIWAPKIDGALNAFLLRKGKNIESYSYRTSAKGADKLIDHTYRLPHYKTPSPMNLPGNTVVLGEVFATDEEGKAMPVVETTSRLLSNVWRSRELQKKGPLQTRIFNILTYKGKDVADRPYADKLTMLKNIAASVPNMQLPPLAFTPEQKMEMLKSVRTGNHPLSSEGIVVYDLNSPTPIKAKVKEDYDVHVRKITEGERGLTGVAAGGFDFSYSADGPIAGTVGTGFDAATRVDMRLHPEKYVGQVARVWAQQKLPSGALRMPVFKDIRPEHWKTAHIDIISGPMGSGKSTKAKMIADKYDLIFNTDNPNRLLPGFIPSSKEQGILRKIKMAEDILTAHKADKRVLVEGTPGAIVKLPGIVDAAHSISFIEPPMLTRVLRIAKRAIGRGTSVLDDLRASHSFYARGKAIENYWKHVHPEKFRKIASMEKTSAVTLTPYQEELRNRLKTQHGMVVGWGLGSGKTIGSIAAMDPHGETKAVVPASLRENFKKEVRAFKPKSKFSAESYESFVKHPESVAGKNIIFDEAHRLRTSGSKRSQLAQYLGSKTNKVLLLTGTPMQNAPHEIAPLINIAAGKSVLPASEKDFNARYLQRVVDRPGLVRRMLGAKYKDEMHGKNLEDFKQRASPYYVSHKGDTATGLPKVHEHNVNVEMSPTQTKVYKSFENQLPGSIRRSIESSMPAGKKDASRLNAFLSATRQVSNTNEKYYAHGKKEYSPKLTSIVKNVSHSPGQSLVYSNYLESGVTPLSELMAKAKIKHGIYTGKMSDADKKKMVSSYNTGKIKSLIVSSSGGEGLDLKKTRQVHITEPHWNDAKIQQVIGRSARKGSHTMLPEKDRNVDVFRYQSMLPEKRHGFLWLKKSRPVSADQYLENMSQRKKKLTSEFMETLQH